MFYGSGGLDLLILAGILGVGGYVIIRVLRSVLAWGEAAKSLSHVDTEMQRELEDIKSRLVDVEERLEVDERMLAQLRSREPLPPS